MTNQTATLILSGLIASATPASATSAEEAAVRTVVESVAVLADRASSMRSNGFTRRGSRRLY
jgi:hypothetical protein